MLMTKYARCRGAYHVGDRADTAAGPQTRDGRGGPAARHSTLSHLPRHRPAPSAHATMISTTRSRHTRSPAHHSHDTRGTYTPDRSGTVTGPRMLTTHATHARMQRRVSRVDPLHEQATTERLKGAKIQRRNRHETNCHLNQSCCNVAAACESPDAAAATALVGSRVRPAPDDTSAVDHGRRFGEPLHTLATAGGV
jgi:hypothetical protein